MGIVVVMGDLLETPVGDFDWGPEARWRRVGRWAKSRGGMLGPSVAIGVGTIMLILGIVLA